MDGCPRWRATAAREPSHVPGFEHHVCVPATPLTPEDEAILQLEGRLIVGHTCKVIVLDRNAPSLSALRRRIAERLDAVAPLRVRLEGAPGRMTWVRVAELDLHAHVVEAPGPPMEPERLHEAVGALFAQHLDRKRPLWRIEVIRLTSGEAALVWRLHHTLADGTTAMRHARALLWDVPAERTHAPAHAAHQLHDDRRRRSHFASFFAREFARTRSPFDGAIGETREVAFARLPLTSLHGAAKELAGATLNDAVVSAVGGGLRSWLEEHHGHLGRVRVKIPVSLHEQHDAGNADSFFFVDVPLEHSDPVERLRAVHAATAKRKAEHDAETMDRLLRDLRSASPRLAGLCERIERSARAFALNVSNVPGPQEPVAVCGARVRSLHSIAEIAEHHAVRVAAVSLCDELFLGFCADPAIIPEVAAMAHATERDAEDVVAAGLTAR